MPLKRFLFLLTVIRFDNPDTREARKAGGDKLAPMSEIFQTFIENCKSNYNSYRYVTIDEMLVGFRGKCGFRLYIKCKSQRYGLKILCLCDSKTHYLLNAFVYTGKNPNVVNPRHLSIPTLTVLELITPIAGSNRNVTGDNWFTSLELLEELKKHKLTYVGTIRRNKREIPKEFLTNRQREVNSSIFGVTRDNTLVSYVPAKKTEACYWFRLYIMTSQQKMTTRESQKLLNFRIQQKVEWISLTRNVQCFHVVAEPGEGHLQSFMQY